MKFTKDEEEFLLENEVCRVATSHNNIPHITPVTYIYEDGFFFGSFKLFISILPRQNSEDNT
jgi:nitroimidazol reductase NimA-like FMN-containing flavoprotein (pyridoxamine 5'-phosphate oxidase superfamily)